MYKHAGRLHRVSKNDKDGSDGTQCMQSQMISIRRIYLDSSVYKRYSMECLNIGSVRGKPKTAHHYSLILSLKRENMLH